jgi:hypothetical protein
MRNSLAALLAVLVLGLASGAAAQSPVDALYSSLDDSSLVTYRNAKRAMVAATDPYIVVAFDTMYEHLHGKTTQVPFTPDLYQRLKSIGHMALAADGAIAPYVATPQAGPLGLEDLAQLAERARAVDAVVDQSSLPPETAARQHRLIAATLALAKAVSDLAQSAKGGTLSEADLRTAVRARYDAFGAQVGPLLLANAAEAARAQVDGLDAAFRDFRRQLSPEEWKRLYVIVLGFRMMRPGNLQFGYFANAMGSDAIDRHLIYGENLTTLEAGEGLLSIIVTDRSLSATYFGDPLRMDRDILADGAEARFLEIFGRLGEK